MALVGRFSKLEDGTYSHLTPFFSKNPAGIVCVKTGVSDNLLASSAPLAQYNAAMIGAIGGLGVSRRPSEKRISP